MKLAFGLTGVGTGAVGTGANALLAVFRFKFALV